MAISEINTMICQPWCKCPLFRPANMGTSDEKAPLLKDVVKPAATYGSSVSDDGSSSGSEFKESPAEYRRRWFCIMITYLGTFTTFIQSSLYWASLWPYLSQVDPTTPESFFGFIISAYSFGSVVSAPLLGYWSNRIKATRMPIVVGFIINIAGNLLMAFVEAFPTDSRRWVMLVARFIAGFGSGNRAVMRSFLVGASRPDELNLTMTFMATFVSAGALLGTGIASALSPIGYPGFVTGTLHLDMYTVEAFVSTLFSVLCVVLYLIPYKEYHISIDEEEKGNSGSEDNSGSELPPIDKLAAFCCILIRFVMLFCVVYDDTIGSPFTMAMFSWNRSEAVLYNGIIQAVSGVFDFVGNIFVGVFLLRYVNERTTIMFGLPSFALFYIISFSWPGLPDQNLGPNFSANGTYNAGGLLDLSNVTTTLAAITPDDALGCNYEWCSYTTRIYVVQYIFAYIFLTLAFSTAFTPTSTLFSKILGPRRQGTWQGIFSASGSLAMTISPILVSTVFEFTGPRVAWGIAFAFLVVVFVFILACWRRLLPKWSSDTPAPSRKPSSVVGPLSPTSLYSPPSKSGGNINEGEVFSDDGGEDTVPATMPSARRRATSRSPSKSEFMRVRHLSRYDPDEVIHPEV